METNDNDDLIAVKKAIKTFFKGLDELDHERIYEVFHPKAKSYMHSTNGKFYVKNANRWKNYCINIKNSLKNPNDRKVYGSIEKIDLSKNIAMVKALLKVKFPTGLIDYVDYYHLLKIDNKWMIVSNSYYGEVTQA